jgi:Ca2+-binding RTX toxin-like protein
MTPAQTLDLARLSLAVYEDDGGVQDGLLPENWEVVFGPPTKDFSSGFCACAYRNTQTGQYAIAFRGTDDPVDLFLADVAVAADFWHSQFAHALEFVRSILEVISLDVLNNQGVDELLLTGHSLGGGIAQVAAAFFGFDGATFDPGGTDGVRNSKSFNEYRVKAQFDEWEVPAGTVPADFTNYVVQYSAVSHYSGAHFPRDSTVEVEGNLVRAAVKTVLESALSPWTRLALPIRFELNLHDMRGIVDMLEARLADGDFPTGLTSLSSAQATTDAAIAPQSSKVEQLIARIMDPSAPEVLSGDLAVNDTLGTEVLPVFQGKAATDSVYGNNAANEMHGGGGRDTFVGYAGDDRLHGGDDGDILLGGLGNDILDGGSGGDVVFGGSGNDVIALRTSSNFTTDSVDGGFGVDRLDIDFSVLNGTSRYEVVAPEGAATRLEAYSSLQTILEALKTAASFVIVGGSTSSVRAEFVNVEQVNLATGTGSSLVIFQNGSKYTAAGSTDTFYADWSSSTSGITWENKPTTVQLVNGVTLQGMERLLLLTGSGNDVLANTLVATNDDLRTGSGNDTVNPGQGDDRIDCGPGDDTVTMVGGYPFTTDLVLGGPGTDTLRLDVSAFSGDVRYDILLADGGKRVLSYSSNIVEIQSALSVAQGFVIVAGGNHQTEVHDVERVNLVTSNGPALVLFQNGDKYSAPQWAADTFYADWSATSTDITWDNKPASVQVVNGVSLQGMERLLLITGAGDDRLTNVETSFNDDLRTGAGDDFVNPGGGDDHVDTGPGDDTITLSSNYSFTIDVLQGGAGTDTLNLDLSALNGGVRYDALLPGGGKQFLTANSSLSEVRSALALAEGFVIAGGSSHGHQTELRGIERVNLVTSNGPALVVYQNGDSYSAPRWTGDTFYADWSSSSQPIVWDNKPGGAAQMVNGVSIQGMERLLVATGAGDDTLSSLDSLGNDDLRTGSGNDTVRSGFGDDKVDAGPGNDLVAPGAGHDVVFGGTGLDTVVFSGASTAFEVRRIAGELEVRARSGQDTDSLSEVERLVFDNVSVAYDLAGNAGLAAKVLGALFGKHSVNDKALAGIALDLLDDGMSYSDLVSLAVNHQFFHQFAGSSSNADFVRFVYHNVVGTNPSQAEVDSFVGLIAAGVHTRESLAMFACEIDLNLANVNLVGLAQSGLEYVPAG